jgi:flavorubredoxin
MSLSPEAKLVCNLRCKEGLLRHYYADWDFQIVKTGDKISLGKRTLSFLEVPMLHWPDSTFTYIEEDRLLLPNDAFGQHLASSERFDDEIEECLLMKEASKYYANILLPFGSIVLKKVDEMQKLGWQPKMIAPSHGIIWRTNPQKIVDSYLKWAKGETKNRVIIAYDSMYGATERIARTIAQGIKEEGIGFEIYKLSTIDKNDVIAQLLEAKGLLVGSSTVDNDMLPDVFSFLGILKGLKPKNKIAGAFGSFGWSGGAVKNIEGMFDEMKAEIFEPGISFKYVPTEEELRLCFEFGKRFAQRIKKQ